MTILITGGAGFIGSNFTHYCIKHTNQKIIVLDKLTYAGNLNNFENLKKSKFKFVRGSIEDKELVESILKKNKIVSVINFAAESHVDRSIHGPYEFIKTNIVGTFKLLEASLTYYSKLSSSEAEKYKFLHVSTDEVYGSLRNNENPFTELNQFKPNSPYAASKASSDHLVRAFNKTYGLQHL